MKSLKVTRVKLCKFLFSFLIIFAILVSFNNFQAYAQEQTVSIPFGAYNPQLDTPTDEWYSPSVIYVNVGDTVTWINDDQEPS